MLYSITGNNREADYVGIVEKIKNGIIYTVEGNSSDSCRDYEEKSVNKIFYDNDRRKA